MQKILIGIFLNIFITGSIPSMGQWVKTFKGVGNNYISSVKTWEDGSVMVAGYTKSSSITEWYGTVSGKANIWTIKLSPNGEYVWGYASKCDWGDIDNWEELHSILLEKNGEFILAGCTKSLNSIHFMVLKISPSGDIIWSRIVGDEKYNAAYDIIKSLDGGYIVAGYSSSFSSSGTNVLIVKLNSKGDIIWQKSYGGILTEEVRSILQTQDGGYIFTGQTFSFYPYDGDIWVVKISSEGDVEWQKVLEHSGIDNVSQMELQGYNNILLAGTIYNKTNETEDICVIKMSDMGLVKWQKAYDWGEDDEASGLVALPDGGCLISATCSCQGINHIAVFKLNSEGEIAWQKYFGEGFLWDEPTDETSVCITTAEEGDIVIGGRIENLENSDSNILLMRLSPTGQINNCSITKDSGLSCYSTDFTPRDSMSFFYDLDLSIWSVNIFNHGYNIEIQTLCPFKKYIPRR